MSLKQFLNGIGNNFGAKMLCVFLAAIMYGAYAFSSLTVKTFTIPIEVRSAGNMTVVSGGSDVRYVKVVLRGNSDQLASVTEDELHAFVDISSQVKSGTYQFPVVLQMGERVRLIDPLEVTKSPERIDLDVEEEVVHYVNISPTLAGNPAHGYEQGLVTVSPSNIMVTGPKSIVENMESIQTEKVDIEGINKKTVQEVALLPRNTFVDIDADTRVEVTVEVSPVESSKELSAIKISYDNLDDTLEVTSRTYSVDVTLEGSLLSLEKVQGSSIIAAADCSMVRDSGTFNVSVFVFTPSDIKLVSQSVESIPITVVRKASDDGGAAED